MRIGQVDWTSQSLQITRSVDGTRFAAHSKVLSERVSLRSEVLQSLQDLKKPSKNRGSGLVRMGVGTLRMLIQRSACFEGDKTTLGKNNYV